MRRRFARPVSDRGDDFVNCAADVAPEILMQGVLDGAHPWSVRSQILFTPNLYERVARAVPLSGATRKLRDVA